MAKTGQRIWKKGRGKLGVLEPLIGDWVADADSPRGPIRCHRSFRRVLGGAYVLLDARWEMSGKDYEEHAIYGVGESGTIRFWSFTSGGKRSEGTLVAAPELHPEAIAFEAKMPAGLARMAYWPGADGSVVWVVESRTKKGWNRFTTHHLKPAEP